MKTRNEETRLISEMTIDQQELVQELVGIRKDYRDTLINNSNRLAYPADDSEEAEQRTELLMMIGDLEHRNREIRNMLGLPHQSLML